MIALIDNGLLALLVDGLLLLNPWRLGFFWAIMLKTLQSFKTFANRCELVVICVFLQAQTSNVSIRNALGCGKERLLVNAGHDIFRRNKKVCLL